MNRFRMHFSQSLLESVFIIALIVAVCLDGLTALEQAIHSGFSNMRRSTRSITISGWGQSGAIVPDNSLPMVYSIQKSVLSISVSVLQLILREKHHSSSYCWEFRHFRAHPELYRSDTKADYNALQEQISGAVQLVDHNSDVTMGYGEFQICTR